MDPNSNPFNMVPKKQVPSKVQPNQKEVVKTNDNQPRPQDQQLGKVQRALQSPAEVKLQGNEHVLIAPSLADPSLVPGIIPAGVAKFQTEAPSGSFAKVSDSTLLSIERAKSKKASPKLQASSQIGGFTDANKSNVKSTISQVNKPKSAQSKKSQKSQKSSKSKAEVVKSKSSSTAKSANKSKSSVTRNSSKSPDQPHETRKSSSEGKSSSSSSKSSISPADHGGKANPKQDSSIKQRHSNESKKSRSTSKTAKPASNSDDKKKPKSSDSKKDK